MLMAEAIPAGKRVTLGGDKNYDTQEFVARTARNEHHPACGAKQYQSQERGGRADHTACGV